MNKDKKLLFGIVIVFLFLATVSFTYAYFTATIVNKDVKNQVVQTGTLELTYTDGPQIIMNNIKPGATITKEISVKNTGTLNTSYNLVWQELANEIINDEMVIEATCTRLNANGVEEGTCEGLKSTPIGKIKIIENISIEPNIAHKYNITIAFKEISVDQNYNQSKNFIGTLGINEYVENTPIYCTFDGDMVQGAEYVNGQYTYSYKKRWEQTGPSTFGWKEFYDDTDGWGVKLTDETSIEPVTSKLCTYINNKPITNMSLMYKNSRAKSIDFSSFNTSNVTKMHRMFEDSQTDTLDLSNFDTSNVTTMDSMFAASSVTMLDLSNFNTSNVTYMSEMFSSSQAAILDVSRFDTSNVTRMNSMFSGSQAVTLNVSRFNTSKVNDMAEMFSGFKGTTLDLSNFDTSKVTSMTGMFSNSSVTEIKGLNNFDTSNVVDMVGMFMNSKVISLDLSNFNTSNVAEMSSMFSGSQAISLDLSSFDTSKVKYMDYLFSYSYNLKNILVSDKFVTSSAKTHFDMFKGCTNLVGGAGTKYDVNHVDKTYARIDGGTDSPGYFTLKQ